MIFNLKTEKISAPKQGGKRGRTFLPQGEKGRNFLPFFDVSIFLSVFQKPKTFANPTHDFTFFCSFLFLTVSSEIFFGFVPDRKAGNIEYYIIKT